MVSQQYIDLLVEITERFANCSGYFHSEDMMKRLKTGDVHYARGVLLGLNGDMREDADTREGQADGLNAITEMCDNA